MQWGICTKAKVPKWLYDGEWCKKMGEGVIAGGSTERDIGDWQGTL